MFKTSSLKLEKKKNKYFIHIKKSDRNDKFINSFLSTTEKIVEKFNLKKYLNNDEYHIELIINKCTPLSEYLKSGINYKYLEKLYINLNEQINFLNKKKISIMKITHKDIFVWNIFDDVVFVFLNNDNLVDIDYDNKIMITKPFKMDEYVAPEMKKIKKLPFTISNKCNLWSLGNIIMYCLKKYKDEKKFNSDYGNDLLEKILNTRLYWAVKRNLEKNPANRFSLLI